MWDFWGTHQHALDAKGRLILPAAMRPALAEGCVLTAGQDYCLYVYPRGEWHQVRDRLREARTSDVKTRNFLRFFFGSATPQTPDAQGRISVPEVLRQYAKLERDVTVLGVDQRVEIWDRATWSRQRQDVERQYAELGEFDPNLPF